MRKSLGTHPSQVLTFAVGLVCAGGTLAVACARVLNKTMFETLHAFVVCLLLITILATLEYEVFPQ